MHMCVPVNSIKLYRKFFFVPVLVDGMLLFLLVLVKATRNIREYGVSRNFNRLTVVILKTSTVCFIGCVLDLHVSTARLI